MTRKTAPLEYSSPACFMHEAVLGSSSIYDTFNRGAPHVLPALPYEVDALEPVISTSALNLHHGEHHKGYVEALNKLVLGTPFGDMTLEEEIIRVTAGKRSQEAVFRNAAQVWNHAFYWHSLRPPGDRAIPGALLSRFDSAERGIDDLKKKLAAAAHQFGSGWVWLVIEAGDLKVLCTGDSDHPLAQGLKPLLTIDVWEHAYCLDYQDRRADYITSLLDRLLNWRFAAENMA